MLPSRVFLHASGSKYRFGRRNGLCKAFLNFNLESTELDALIELPHGEAWQVAAGTVRSAKSEKEAKVSWNW